MKLEVKDIMKIMDHFSLLPLGEMHLHSGDTEMKLVKNIAQIPTPTPPVHEKVVMEEEPPMMSSVSKKRDTTSATPAIVTDIVTAPIVGTFYHSPAPDAPPFTGEGSSVKAGEPIAIIEAMKVMNKLEAEFDMKIVRIIAENGSLIEYGTPLFEVQKL